MECDFIYNCLMLSIVKHVLIRVIRSWATFYQFAIYHCFYLHSIIPADFAGICRVCENGFYRRNRPFWITGVSRYTDSIKSLANLARS